MFRQQMADTAIDRAIAKVMQWEKPVPDECFPAVYRAWMSHPAFQVA